jgi:deoxyribonuclease V
MLMQHLHDWNLTPQEAIALQKELALQIITDDCLQSVSYIAGADVALEGINKMHAAVVIMSYPDLKIVEMRCHEQELKMPYIPGLLSFREMPALLGAFKKVQQKPDLILVDGMGIAHPRGIGIASHLGLWLEIPTIGVGKKKLVGTYHADALSNEKGSTVALMHHEKMIGAVVRTKMNVKPLFISPGHMVSIRTSIDYVLACCRGYRLPELTRYADKLSKKDGMLHKNDMCG